MDQSARGTKYRGRQGRLADVQLPCPREGGIDELNGPHRLVQKLGRDSFRYPHGRRLAAETTKKTVGIEVVNVVPRVCGEIGRQFRRAYSVRNAPVRNPDIAMSASRQKSPRGRRNIGPDMERRAQGEDGSVAGHRRPLRRQGRWNRAGCAWPGSGCPASAATGADRKYSRQRDKRSDGERVRWPRLFGQPGGWAKVCSG